MKTLLNTDWSKYSDEEKSKILISSFLVVKGLLIPEPSGSVLHIAARSGDTKLLKKIVELENIDINLADAFGRTALHIATCLSDFEMVKFLVGLEVNIKTKDSDGNSAIDYSVNCLNVEITQYLLDKGETLPFQSTIPLHPSKINSFYKELNDRKLDNVSTSTAFTTEDILIYSNEQYNVDLKLLGKENIDIL